MGLLNLQPQQLVEAGRDHENDRQSDDSALAVQDGGRAGGSRRNSGEGAALDDGGSPSQTTCSRCHAAQEAPGAFACGSCGQWLGGDTD